MSAEGGTGLSELGLRNSPELERDGVHGLVTCIPHGMRYIRIKADRIARIENVCVERNGNAEAPLQHDAELLARMSFHFDLGLCTAANLDDQFDKRCVWV